MKINDLTKLQPSKRLIPDLSNKLTEPHTTGSESALELSTKFDFIIKVLTEAKKSLSEGVIKEIREGNQERNGYKLEVRETGVTYDYSTCKDPVWNECNKNITELKKILSEREKFLKSLPYDGIVIVDEDTGETCIIYPPVKRSTESPIFNLQK